MEEIPINLTDKHLCEVLNDEDKDNMWPKITKRPRSSLTVKRSCEIDTIADNGI